MIIYFYKSLTKKRLLQLDNFKAGSWVHVLAPSEEELLQLEKTHGLDEDFLRDALDPFESPRLETYKKKIYFFTRVPYVTQQEMQTIPLLFVIDERFILTLTSKSLPFLEHLTKEKKLPPTTQRIKFFLYLLSHINKEYTKNIVTINKHIRAIKGDLENITNKHIVQFVRYEDILNDFLAALLPTNNILEQLLSKKVLHLYEDDYDLIEDIALNFQQLIDLSKANLKTIMNVRDAYSTILNNNLNQTMKLLAGLTILLTVPTIIASFYGMNITLPFQHVPHAFSFITLLTLLIMTSLFIIFRKVKWF